MDASIERLAHEIGASFKSRSKRFFRAGRYTKIVLVVGSAAATVAHFFVGDITSIGAHVGIAASVIIFLSAILLVFLDDDASEELEQARQAIDHARNSEERNAEIVDVLNEYEIYQTRANELYLAMKSMKDAIEKSLEIDSLETLKLVDSVLDSAKRSLTIACGFALAQHYTICVYEARRDVGVHAKTRLHCVAHHRSIPCNISNARVWDAGASVVGIAQSSGNEVIVPDTSDEDAGLRFVNSQHKPEDDERYRSMAAVPIRVAGIPEPWGVVIATSDRPHHFSSDHEGGVHPAEAVRALAGMLALAVKSRAQVNVITAAAGATSAPNN